MKAKRNWFTVSEDGTVSIPAELLAKYGLKSGDEVGVVETESGLFLVTRGQLAEQLLDQIGEQIRDKYADLTEDEITQVLMQRGRDKICPQLLKDLYGIDTEE